MRAKTKIHVEYEVFKTIIDSIIVAEYIEDLKDKLVPQNDEIAQKRFDEGVKSAGNLILNLMDRRKHRLPPEHEDYLQKGE